MKTKTTRKEDQPTKNHKKITEKKTQEKNKTNGECYTFHGPLFQKWIDGRY